MSVAAPTVAPEPGEEGWGVLVYFTVGLASVLVATTSLGLFLPDIIDDLDLSPAEQGWLGSSLLLANVVFSIPMNWWVSRFRPWRTAAVGFLAASGLIALAGGAPGFGVLLLARMGLGMVLQACQSPRNILIIQWISKRRFGAGKRLLHLYSRHIDGDRDRIDPIHARLAGRLATDNVPVVRG